MKKGFIGLIIAAIIAIAIIGVIVYKTSNEPAISNEEFGTNEVPKAITPEEIDVKTLELIGIEGKSVLELLKDKTKVEYTESDTGAFITTINGIVNSDKEFWLYSVNGTDVTVAADKYITKNGDKIKWEYKGF